MIIKNKEEKKNGKEEEKKDEGKKKDKQDNQDQNQEKFQSTPQAILSNIGQNNNSIINKSYNNTSFFEFQTKNDVTLDKSSLGVSADSKDFFYMDNDFIYKIRQKLRIFLGPKIMKFLTKHLINRTDLLLFVNNICSIIIYRISLIPCYRDATECTIRKGMKFYIIVGILDLISCILLSIYTAFAFLTNKHYFHFYYLIPIYVYFFGTYTGTDAKDHGFYNSLGYISFWLFLFPLIYLCVYLAYLVKKKKFKKIIIILSTILFILVSLLAHPGFSCENWDLGLNNTRIDNDINKYPCHILHPGKNKCYLTKMDGFFDFSKIFRPSCSAKKILKQEKKRFLEHIGNQYNVISKLNHFGYPITTQERFNLQNSKDLKEFQELINKNTIKMDVFTPENYPNEPYPEVEVFFDENDYGNIKINLTRNETLSEERKNIAKNKSQLFNNVFILYIDAISRNHFLRKFKKIAKYIEPYFVYEPNEYKKKFSAFQFMKYNTLKGLTMPNIEAMFYGSSLTDSNRTNLVKYFKEQGFVTGHTGTTCGKEIFSVNGIIREQHMNFDNWDHENIALFCDPNFFDYRYPMNRGVASVIKRCLYGNYAFEYMMEYAKQFWKSYPDNKKFFRIHFNEGHEGTMQLVTYLEDPLFEFVKSFFENGWFEDTFLFIVSDHGNHMLGPWAVFRTNDYLIEGTLGTLFFVIPNKNILYESRIYDYIWNNQQTFVTPYDIHNTLVHLAYGDDIVPDEVYSKRGISLLKEIDPLEKFCESPKHRLGIAKSDCKCKLYNF